MAGMVSVRIQKLTIKEAMGQARHDSREKTQDYVNAGRTGENLLILGSMNTSSLRGMVNNAVARYSAHHKRAWRKDSNHIVSGIITFSKEARDNVNNAPPDAQAERFICALGDQYKAMPVYLVRHADETTTHYHFQFLNLCEDDMRPLSVKLGRKQLSELQDLAGRCFEDVGLGRGKRRVDRMRDGEPFEAVTHRTVRQLHASMAAEVPGLTLGSHAPDREAVVPDAATSALRVAGGGDTKESSHGKKLDLFTELARRRAIESLQSQAQSQARSSDPEPEPEVDAGWAPGL